MFTKLYCAAISAKTHFLHRLREEKGDTGLVVALIMVAIAIGLAFAFRERISQAISGAFDSVDDAITDLSSHPPISNP